MSTGAKPERVTRWAVQCDRIRCVEGQAKKAFAGHAITPLFASGGKNEYRGWRCAKPGDCTYAFTLLSVPGRLVIMGDLGALIVQREFDMLAWARGSVHDVSYFAEKVPKEIPTEEFDADMVRAFVAEVDHDIAAGEHEPEGKLAKLWGSEARAAVLGAADEGRHEVSEALYRSGLLDSFDYPDFDNWKHGFLWQREAIKWFLANWKG